MTPYYDHSPTSSSIVKPNSAGTINPEQTTENQSTIYTRSVQDPIYGTIRLSEEEMDIINSKLFRRLHQIRQNGLLYFVFPAAKHTRFEHSLGALYVSQSILSNLLFNSSVAAKKSTASVAEPNDAQPGQAVDFNKFDQKQRDYISRITRLAALVHDLGHGPLSHAFDSFSPRWKDLEDMSRSSSELNELVKELIKEKDQRKRVKHEVISCILFSIIWNHLKKSDQDTVFDVAAVILGEPNICKNSQYRCFIELMHDIVASAPADADRMDYLERDSRSIGVTYGFFDRCRLLKSFLVYKEESSPSDPETFRLGIKYSGIRAVENFIQARFQLFVQVYYHKTNRATELMLKEIAEIAKSSITINLFENIGNDINAFEEIYVELSDDRFLRILRGKDSQMKVKDDKINQIAERIFNRNLWKRVYEGIPKDTNKIKQNFETTYDKTYDNKITFYEDNVDPKATKDLNEGAALLKRGSDGIYEKQQKMKWSDHSSIIEALELAEKNISRIYLQETSENGDIDPTILKELRIAARSKG
jgi:HD superfamily phosphohydrolase